MRESRERGVERREVFDIGEEPSEVAAHAVWKTRNPDIDEADDVHIVRVGMDGSPASSGAAIRRAACSTTTPSHAARAARAPSWRGTYPRLRTTASADPTVASATPTPPARSRRRGMRQPA